MWKRTYSGPTSTTPRLRHAYTQAKNFLIGQTFSNFQDPDAGPDGLDFQGPNSRSRFAIRSFATRLVLPKEQPEFLRGEGKLRCGLQDSGVQRADRTVPTPDGTMKFRHEMHGGHIQVAGLFRAISAYLPNGKSDSVFGWGVMVSGAQKVYRQGICSLTRWPTAPAWSAI